MEIYKDNEILIRHIEYKDIDNVYNLMTTKNMYKYMNSEPPQSKDEVSTWIKISRNSEYFNENNIILLILDIKNSKEVLIGMITLTKVLLGVNKNSNTYEIGIIISPVYQGIGIATKAINEVIKFGRYKLGIDTFMAVYHKKNIASSRLFDRLKFRKSDIKRPICIDWDGNIVDYGYTTVIKSI